MILANLVMIFMYIVPLAIGISVSRDLYRDWDVGEFLNISHDLGSFPMALWFALAGMVAVTGM